VVGCVGGRLHAGHSILDPDLNSTRPSATPPPDNLQK